MILQTCIRWTLYLGDKKLSFEEDLLDSQNSDKLGNEDTLDFNIPQLLHEVYYVEQLSRSEGYNPGEIIFCQDKTFEYVVIFRNLIAELIHKKYEYLLMNEDIAGIENNHYQKLKGIRGHLFDDYVNANLQEPFLSRNLAYKIFNMLPRKYKPKSRGDTQRNVISSSARFNRFWNNGLLSLASMQNDVYKKDLVVLHELLRKLDKNNGLNKYTKSVDRGRCFSKTEVIKNGKREDVLSFSGVNLKPPIKTAIDTIVNSGHFLNPTCIIAYSKVRYYICPAQYITYDEAKASKVEFENRMFSCCERKTFAEYNWQGVTSYTMIVKYPPCELCQFPVYKHSKKYNGKVNHEIKHDFTDRKKRYDEIARTIYKKIHP